MQTSPKLPLCQRGVQSIDAITPVNTANEQQKKGFYEPYVVIFRCLINRLNSALA
jgi:hypothetical protein